MIDAPRTARWPAPGFGWRALALYVGPALLLAATVLPRVLLLGRLPRYEVPPYQWHAMNWLGGAVMGGFWLAAAWGFVLVVSLTPGRPHRRMVWELWVPLLYGFGGMLVALGLPSVVLSLDRPYGLPDARGGLLFALDWAAIVACAGVGLLLGRRAAATEHAPRPQTRAVWIADVDADLSWWLLQGIVALVTCALFTVPFVLAGAWVAAAQVDAGMLYVLVTLVAWASRGHVVVSPSGIRVHYGHVRLLGWEVGIDQIAAVEVVQVRVLRSWAAWKGWSHLALRDGPALVVRTRTGRRRVVTLPQAEDAAVTLRAWLAGASS